MSGSDRIYAHFGGVSFEGGTEYVESHVCCAQQL